MRSRIVRVVLVTAAAGVALVLGACRPVQMGAAAIVDDTRIPISAVNEPAQEVVKLAPQAAQQGNIAAGILQVKIIDQLVTTLARREGIGWTQGDIDNAISTATQGQGLKPNQVYSVPLVNGSTVQLPSDEAAQYGRDLYLEQVLVKRYGGTDTQSGQAELAKRLVALAQELGVSVDPRYGQFDSSNLSLRQGNGGLWTPDQSS